MNAYLRILSIVSLKVCVVALCALMCVSSTSVYAQPANVGIGTVNPEPSALLDLTATDKGLLIPRMTHVQKLAVATPATGLLIYQTDSISTALPSTFYYYNGTVWIPLLSSASGWSLTGNTGTTAGTNFIGTTDAQDFVVKTNNAERLRVYAGGDIAIISDTSADELRFTEPSGSGTNYTSIEARAQAANIPWTLPDTQGGVRTVLTNDGAGNLYWSHNAHNLTFAVTTLSTFNSNQNNLYLDPSKAVFRICASANYDLTGMSNGVDGRFVIVSNVCTTGNVRIMNENANSSAANRILIGGAGSFSCGANESVLLVYDGVSQRWRVVGKTP